MAHFKYCVKKRVYNLIDFAKKDKKVETYFERHLKDLATGIVRRIDDLGRIVVPKDGNPANPADT